MAMDVVFGINPLKEILRTDEGGLTEILISRDAGKDSLKEILALAAERGVPVEYRDRGTVERLAGRASHQGVVGLCRPFAYATLDEVVAGRHGHLHHDVLLLLDSITDPQNLGTLIRTAHCFGVNGVVVPSDRAAAVTGTVMKASAGAARHIPVAMVVNLSRTIDALKEQGFWIYGADAGADRPLDAMDYADRIGLVMGSEGRGLRPLIRRKCDFFISIPMLGRIDSLNVAVAAGIILNDITRKKHTAERVG
jgi:23S rRNA (guanosine2251-2'-O)-methyltransferase